MELRIAIALSVEESVKDSKSPNEVSKLKIKQKSFFESIKSLVGFGNIDEQGGNSCSEI